MVKVNQDQPLEEGFFVTLNSGNAGASQRTMKVTRSEAGVELKNVQKPGNDKTTDPQATKKKGLKMETRDQCDSQLLANTDEDSEVDTVLDSETSEGENVKMGTEKDGGFHNQTTRQLKNASKIAIVEAINVEKRDNDDLLLDGLPTNEIKVSNAQGGATDNNEFVQLSNKYHKVDIGEGNLNQVPRTGTEKLAMENQVINKGKTTRAAEEPTLSRDFFPGIFLSNT